MKKALLSLCFLFLLAGSSTLLAQPAKVLLLEPETDMVPSSPASNFNSLMEESFSKFKYYLELIDVKKASVILENNKIYINNCKTNDEYFKVGDVLQIDKIVYTNLICTDFQYIRLVKIFDIINRTIFYQKEIRKNINSKYEFDKLTEKLVNEITDSLYLCHVNKLENEMNKAKDVNPFVAKRNNIDIYTISGFDNYNDPNISINAPLSSSVMPAIITKVCPIYPEELKNKGIEGKVNLYVLIDINGRTKKVKIGKTSNNDILDNLAIDAIKQWEFTPAVGSNGKAHEIWVNIPILYTLEKDGVYGDKGMNTELLRMPEVLKTTGVDPKGCVKDIQGKVVLYLLIGKNGKVKQADIAESSGYATLDEAAKEVTSRIIFLPAVAPSGKIVRVWIKYPVSFH